MNYKIYTAPIYYYYHRTIARFHLQFTSNYFLVRTRKNYAGV